MSALRQIVADVLEMSVDEVTDETSPTTAKSWDSMKHIELVLALETRFGIKFAPSEIMLINSLGAARDLLGQKGAAI